MSPDDREEGYRIRYCGIRATGTADSPDVSVRVRASGKLDVLGVMTCESRWVCPCCAEQANLRDARRTEALVKAHLEKGGTAIFVTLTVPSRSGDNLAAVIEAVRGARALASQQRCWRYVTAKAKLRARIQRLEITRGIGWHVHLHEIWLLDATAKEVAEWDDATDGWRKRPNPARDSRELIEHRTFRKAIHQDVSDAWKHAVRSTMHRTPHKRFGVDVKGVTLDDAGKISWYVAGATDEKGASTWSPAAELALDVYKKGRAVADDAGETVKSMSMWNVLEHVAAGDAAALRDWRTYARETHNVTQFAFPLEYAVELGLCDADGNLVELSEEALQDDETVARIILPVPHWNAFAEASAVAPVGRIAARWAETEGQGDLIDRIRLCLRSLGWDGYWGPETVLGWSPPFDDEDEARLHGID